MSRNDTMRDPRYSSVLLEIERSLHEADHLASVRGLTLTDSNIRSLLVRAINDAKGKTARSVDVPASDKDRLLAEAQQKLAAVRAAVVEERVRPDGTVERRPSAAADWIAALEAIKASAAVRTGPEPGSRGYLEFLRGFIRDAGRTP